MKFSFCHCEEGAGADDAAIHRVSGDAGGLSVRLLRASGSPRAFSPRDDTGEVWCVVFVIARRERSD